MNKISISRFYYDVKAGANRHSLISLFIYGILIFLINLRETGVYGEIRLGSAHLFGQAEKRILVREEYR